MMSKKTLQEWFDDVEVLYNENENTTDMDEGDFNVLECEYDTLKAVLNG